MSMQANGVTIGLSPRVRPILDSVAGETPGQKIALLLRDSIQRHSVLQRADRQDQLCADTERSAHRGHGQLSVLAAPSGWRA